MKFETLRMHFISDVFGLFSSRNFATMATWRTDVSLLGRFRVTFTPEGNEKFVPRDQVSLSIVVYCLLLLHKNKWFIISFIHKNCSGQLLSVYFLCWEILNLNLTYATLSNIIWCPSGIREGLKSSQRMQNRQQTDHWLIQKINQCWFHRKHPGSSQIPYPIKDSRIPHCIWSNPRSRQYPSRPWWISAVLYFMKDTQGIWVIFGLRASELLCFKDAINFAALLGFFLAAGNKKFQRANETAMRVWCKWCKWIHPTTGWRRDEHGTHKHAHGS